MKIISCPLEELPRLQDLAIRTFEDTYAAHNTPEVMADYVKQSFNESQLARELGHPGSEFYVLTEGDEWIGYIKLNEGEAQTDPRTDNVLEIERIYVDRAHHRKGYGKVLLQKAIAVGRAKNKDRIWLGVWEHNPRAIAFYESQGFVKNGTHVFMIGGEAQSDWVMELEL